MRLFAWEYVEQDKGGSAAAPYGETIGLGWETRGPHGACGPVRDGFEGVRRGESGPGRESPDPAPNSYGAEGLPFTDLRAGFVERQELSTRKSRASLFELAPF